MAILFWRLNNILWGCCNNIQEPEHKLETFRFETRMIEQHMLLWLLLGFIRATTLCTLIHAWNQECNERIQLLHLKKHAVQSSSLVDEFRDVECARTIQPFQPCEKLSSRVENVERPRFTFIQLGALYTKST